MTRRSFVLDFRASQVGGPVVGPVLSSASGVILQLADLASPARETGHAVVLLHGFNVSRSEGRQTLLRLAHSLDGPVRATFVAVLWPGDDILSPFTYSLEEPGADLTGRKLAGALLKAVPNEVQLSFVAHSLGCRVALEAISVLAARGRRVGEVVLMAAAVDRDVLARSDRYVTAARAAHRVRWLASTSDRVLQLAYPAGDAIAAMLFGGYTRAALGRHGPSPHGATQVPDEVSGIQVGSHGVGHSDYLPADPPNVRQQSAAGFITGVLRGEDGSYV